MRILFSILFLWFLAGPGLAGKNNADKIKPGHFLLLHNVNNTKGIDVISGILNEQDPDDFYSFSLSAILPGFETRSITYFSKKTFEYFPTIYGNVLQNLLIDLPPPIS